MNTDEQKRTDQDLRRLIQRQFVLLDFQAEDRSSPVRAWPISSGLSDIESARIFEILEKWCWIAGAQSSTNEIKCVITDKGNKYLSQIRAGQTIVETDEINFDEDDRLVLRRRAECTVSLPDGTSPIQKIRQSIHSAWIWCNLRKLGPAAALCFALALVVSGVQIITNGPHWDPWGILLVAIGVIIFLGRISFRSQNYSSADSVFRWLPAGICLVVLLPIGWQFLDLSGLALTLHYWMFQPILGVLAAVFRH